MVFNAQSPINYNWQNSKQGWLSGGGCNLTALPNAIAMKSFNTTPLMRSGNLQANLGLNASDYNHVSVSLKNPTTGSGNARLYIYPPGTNTASCYFVFQVDTSMVGFSTYNIDLTATPNSGTYTGTIARFGLRGPWGVTNGDTIFWENMTVSNTNSTTMGNLYEDQFDDYIVSNWGNLNIASVPKFNLFETACEELKISSDTTTLAPSFGYITYVLDNPMDITGYEKITLSERSSSYFPIRIDLEDSLGNVTNGINGKITVTTNSSMNHSSLMSFVYPDVAFNESNVDKTIIKKLRVYFNPGTPNIPSPIFIDYLAIGDSTGLNNAIGLSEIDSCNCDVISYDTLSVCDSIILSNGNIATVSGTYIDSVSLYPACDSIAILYLTVLNSSTSLISISNCDQYSWNGNMYNQSGSYFFNTVNYLGCDSIAELALTINESPSVQITVSSPEIIANVTGGTNPISYLWNTGEITSSITPLNNGNFYVDVQDANNCDNSDSIAVNFVSLDENKQIKFEIFPNPSSDFVYFKSNFSYAFDYSLKLYDLNGKNILSEDVTINNGEKNRIDISKLSKGVYIIEITNSFSVNFRSLLYKY